LLTPTDVNNCNFNQNHSLSIIRNTAVVVIICDLSANRELTYRRRVFRFTENFTQIGGNRPVRLLVKAPLTRRPSRSAVREAFPHTVLRFRLFLPSHQPIRQHPVDLQYGVTLND